MNHKLLQQALDALNGGLYRSDSIVKAIEALEVELAKPEQEPEPSACVTDDFAITYTADVAQRWRDKGWKVVPFYTAPPRKEWVGLTDEQKKEATAICKAPWHSWAVDPIALCNYVETKLKEKNT
jgi:hypothetical protein